MKYKVGNRVNTIDPVGVGTIVGTGNDGVAPYLVSLDGWAGKGHMGARHRLTAGEPAPDSSNWWFNERDLTLITPEAQSIHITTDGTTTHAVLKDGKSVVKRSKAVCAPSDVFDFETGARVAFDRLISPKVLGVKRRAKVGEYIQIVDAFMPDGYKNGDVLKVLGLYGCRYVKGTAPKTGVFIGSEEYIVLEGYQPPSELTVREVERQANPGEWVKIINNDASSEYGDYLIGDIMQIVYDNYGHGSAVIAKAIKPLSDKDIYPEYGENCTLLLHSEYVVLENYQPLKKPALPRFTYEGFKRGDFVVHCPTEEEANTFCAYLHGKGDKWYNGDSYIWNTSWRYYKEKTYYSGDGHFGRVEYYQRKNKTIIPFNAEDLD